MDKLKVSLQKNLKNYEEMLKNEGYEVVYFGQHDGDADVTLISGVNREYEEIEAKECHPNLKGTGNFVIDVSDMEPSEVLDLIKNRGKYCDI